jgi:hypothetical protein
MGPQSWFEDLSPTRPQALNFFQKNPALPAEEVSDFNVTSHILTVSARLTAVPS